MNTKLFLILFFVPLTIKAQNILLPDCSEQTTELHLVINLDYMGNETWWSINQNFYDEEGGLVDLEETIAYCPPGEYPANYQGLIMEHLICLLPGTYTLTMGDTYGDGQAFIYGSYELRLGDEVLVSGGGNFGSLDVHIFYVPGLVDPVFGCLDQDAVNYNVNATNDDGSCYYNPGCTNPEACNFCNIADFDDGSCEFVTCVLVGCMDEYANNYNSLANTPGLCEYQTPSFIFEQDCKDFMFQNTTDYHSLLSDGVMFVWDFGDGTEQVVNEDLVHHTFENGMYNVVLFFVQGLSQQAVSFQVVINDFTIEPMITFEDDILYCNSEAELYLWYYNDEFLDQTTQNMLQADFQEGEYVCELMGQGGCSIQTSMVVTGVTENSVNTMIVFPSLVSEYVTVSGYSGEVYMYDNSGRLIQKYFLSNQTTIDCSSINSGMYLLKTKEKNSQTYRFVKQ